MSLTVTDQFCGAGGSSIGATAVDGVELRLGLNHWRRAIETHSTNFPDADHDCADISATDPRRYLPTDILLTSPECTNHSLAKGVSRKKTAPHLFETNKEALTRIEAERSRATMFDVPRFAEQHNVQWWIEIMRGLEKEELLSEDHYWKLRPECQDSANGGEWHSAIGEVFACDFRVMCGVELEYWPHGDISRPNEEIKQWWTGVFAQAQEHTGAAA